MKTNKQIQIGVLLTQLEKYLETQKNILTPRNLNSSKNSLQRFRGFVEDEGLKFTNEITSVSYESYLSQLGYLDNSIYKHLKILRSFLKVTGRISQ